MAKFVLTTWAACLARQKPVSTRAKPACMKITSTAPMTTHSRFVAMPSPSTVVVSGGIDCSAPRRRVVSSKVPAVTAPATTPPLATRRQGGDPAIRCLLSSRTSERPNVVVPTPVPGFLVGRYGGSVKSAFVACFRCGTGH